MANDINGSEALPEKIELPLVWVGVEELSAQFVNQFILQLDGDGGSVLLTAGLASPPAMIGTIEEQAAQVSRLSYVQVKPVARVVLSRAKFQELVAVMTQVADTWPMLEPRSEK